MPPLPIALALFGAHDCDASLIPTAYARGLTEIPPFGLVQPRYYVCCQPRHSQIRAQRLFECALVCARTAVRDDNAGAEIAAIERLRIYRANPWPGMSHMTMPSIESTATK